MYSYLLNTKKIAITKFIKNNKFKQECLILKNTIEYTKYIL